MTEKYKPKAGDRVRVLLEGEVHRTGGDDPSDFTIGANLVYGNSKWVVSIEKVEPPVVTFKPGDVVRGLGLRGLYITLAKDGYVNHQFGMFYPYDGVAFTSEHYELVTL